MGSVIDELIALAKARASAVASSDLPARPDPVGPGQALLQRLDIEREAEHQRGMERERVHYYARELYDPRYD